MKIEKIQEALKSLNKDDLNKVISDEDLDKVSGSDAV